MKISFNGREYILVDELGRNCGWTRDKAKADQVLAATAEFKTIEEMPMKLRKALAMADFVTGVTGGIK